MKTGSRLFFYPFCLIGFLGVLFASVGARALGSESSPYDAEYFRPRPGSPDGSLISVDLAQVSNHWIPDAENPKRNGLIPWALTGQFFLHYSSRPATFYLGPENHVDLIRDRFAGSASVAIAIKERFQLALTMPWVMYQNAGEANGYIGDVVRKTFPAGLSSYGAGDFTFSFKGVLYNSQVAGKARGLQGGLGLVGDLTLPTGDTDSFLGSPLPTFRLKLLAHIQYKRFTAAVNVGGLVARPEQVSVPAGVLSDRPVPLNLRTGYGITWGAGFQFRLVDKRYTESEKRIALDLIQEGFGTILYSVFADSATYNTTSSRLPLIPIELTTGLRFAYTTAAGDQVGLGVFGGPGIGGGGTSALGVPDWRAGFSFSFTGSARRPKKELAPPPPLPPPPPVVEAPPPPAEKKPEPIESVGEVKIVNGKLYVPDLQFDFDSSVVTPGISDKHLDDAATLLKNRTDITELSIEGHTDDRGSAGYNLDLSRRRAQSVLAQLVARGVGSGRLSSKGYGLTCPIVSNSTELGRAQNRRVEFWFVKVGATLIERPPAQCAPLTNKVQAPKKQGRGARKALKKGR